jgi:hypothetical protein
MRNSRGRGQAAPDPWFSVTTQCFEARKSSSQQTHRWREPDSNHRSRFADRLLERQPERPGAAKMLKRDRWFESPFLQRRVTHELAAKF